VPIDKSKDIEKSLNRHDLLGYFIGRMVFFFFCSCSQKFSFAFLDCFDIMNLTMGWKATDATTSSLSFQLFIPCEKRVIHEEAIENNEKKKDIKW